VTRVAVVGAAGFVGGAVIREALRRRYEVIAVARATSHLHLKRYGVRCLEPAGVDDAGPLDAVINLAYPTGGSNYDVPERNRALLGTIERLAGSGARVIHTSTLAVFGFGLEKPIGLGPVPFHRDFPYVESKIAMERMLLRRFSGRDLAIVRLGNVWGPASAGWTAGLADKLIFGEPVAVTGQDGFSNVTDVANVASFLCHLVEGALPACPHFSHLAEFAETRWSWWLGCLAGVVGCEALSTATPPRYSASYRQELRRILSRFAAGALMKDVGSGRLSGSWWRTVLRALPPAAFRSLKRWRSRRSALAATAPDAGDAGFFAVMSCPTAFTADGLAGWQPVVDRDASWRRAEEYLREAGFGSPQR